MAKWLNTKLPVDSGFRKWYNISNNYTCLLTKRKIWEKSKIFSWKVQPFAKKVVYISREVTKLPTLSVLTERVFSFNTAATPGDERHTRPGGLTCQWLIASRKMRATVSTAWDPRERRSDAVVGVFGSPADNKQQPTDSRLAVVFLSVKCKV